MFCTNCGKPVEPGHKFCPYCGAPVELPEEPAPEVPAAAPVTPEPPAPPVEEAPAPVEEAPAAPEEPKIPETAENFGMPEAPKAPEIPEAPWQSPPPPPPPPKAAPAGGPDTPPSGGVPGVDENTMTLILRIVCGVFAVIFAIAALRRLPGFVWSLFHAGNLIHLPFNAITGVVGLAAPVVMCAVLVLAAVKWDKKMGDAVVLGAQAAAIIRLVSLLLNIIVNGLFFGVPMRYLASGRSLLYVLGYVAVAAILFGIMYLMGCPPLLGKNADQIKESVTGSFEEISEAVNKAQADYQAKQAAQQPKSAPGSVPPPPAPGADLTYASVGNQQPPTYTARLKKTNRGLLKYILLNIITCGIYSWLVVHSLSEDMNDVCQGDGNKTGGLVAFILLGFITCGIYQIIWWYKLCNRMAANAPRYGLSFQENGTTYLLWTLIGALVCGIGPLVALHFILRNANALCTAYNQYNGLYGAPGQN